MRYDASHKDETRRKVLKAAARAIRAQGPFKVGVAGVMSDAGLTHGGFYAHFASKDDLVAAGVTQMFDETATRFERVTEGLDGPEAVAAYIDFYLSALHRDSRVSGCPLPFLAADAPRLPELARQAFAEGVAGMHERMAARLAAIGRRDPTGDAKSLLAEMVGALALARADPDPIRSDAILAASRAALKARFNLELMS
jgi:TetR/AcrR family transcriptional repressor of nem operon